MPTHRGCIVALVGTALAHTSVAAGDTVSATPPTHWYGAELMVADAVTDLTIGASVGAWSPTVSPVLGFIGIPTYLLSGPVLHALHGREYAVGASVALRLFLPMGGALGGLALGLLGRRNCPPGADDGEFEPACAWYPLELAGVGILGGILAAEILDDTLNSDERVPPPARRANARGAPFSIRPNVASTRDAARNNVPTLGIAGTF